jgi:hypothetical protein
LKIHQSQSNHGDTLSLSDLSGLLYNTVPSFPDSLAPPSFEESQQENLTNIFQIKYNFKK